MNLSKLLKLACLGAGLLAATVNGYSWGQKGHDVTCTYSGRYPFSIPVIPVHFFVSKDRYLLRS